MKKISAHQKCRVIGSIFVIFIVVFTAAYNVSQYSITYGLLAEYFIEIMAIIVMVKQAVSRYIIF